MRVLILDQFCGVHPYSLQKDPCDFEELAAEMVILHGKDMFRPARIEEVDPNTFKTPWATTVVAADENGRAFVWRTNWDSSG